MADLVTWFQAKKAFTENKTEGRETVWLHV